ncbi:hypothetical protein PAXRUDRAFT_580644 [Paxillus rubicundulus Ve08.2h10]|uniref:Uncharacterized protein n=1 Tax=Paxillus rubicundulus Ve08.2h10 TaxID=930991 RepID=A0A0D0DZB4_9AGAM|nr:hypothetical protein PAXRUDRAFT_580644 [Paxillus rubicundulus Ve08.2h10]
MVLTAALHGESFVVAMGPMLRFRGVATYDQVQLSSELCHHCFVMAFESQSGFR